MSPPGIRGGTPLACTRGVDTALSTQWFALHVKARHEAVTSGDLTRKGIECYLPLVQRLRHWSDRKKMVDFPLFPGYVFVSVAPLAEDFLRVLKSRGAVRLLSLHSGRPTAVPGEEIESLKLMIGSGRDLDVYPHLKVGRGVRVKRGPLAGAQGVIQNKDDQYQFLVNIGLLGRSVGVRIYADDLEAA